MMKGPKDSYRRPALRAAVLSLLICAYGGVGFYARLVLHTDVIHTHFAYIPIVLAGLWWGKKCLGVAVLLSILTLGFEAAGPGPGPLWSDLGRSMFFFIVAGCIGFLSEKVTTARRALMASEEKYRLLVDNSLAGVFVVRNGRVVFVNHRLGEMLGYEAPELLGLPLARLTVGEVAVVREGPGIAGQTPDRWREVGLLGKDGRHIWVELTSAPTLYEGESAVLYNVYDITDRREAEAKRVEYAELARRQEEQLVHSARLAELGEMAASIAHELNQPLTGIRNFARNTLYMLEYGAGSEHEVKANLSLIAEQVDRASRIIAQMRSLTRKSDRLHTPVDINTTLRESVDFISPQLHLHGIQASFELSPDLPRVLGDKIRLEQVFLNVLTNARQAMEESAERRLGVRTYWETENSRAVVVEISDTGRGFPAEEAHKLFTPFFTTKKAGEGTGLGLSISLTIIKEHQGEIDAIGAPGVGSVFRIMLPAVSPGSVGGEGPDEGPRQG